MVNGKGRISIADIAIKGSFFLYAFSICFSHSLQHLFGALSIIIIRLIAVSLLVFCSKGKIKTEKKYLATPLLIALGLVFYFWNNAQIEDAKWVMVASYLITAAYACLLSLLELKGSNIVFLCKIIIAFGIVTSFVSWMELVLPGVYGKMIYFLMPKKHAIEAIWNLETSGNLWGLTAHYSYNAFYIVVSILLVYFLPQRDGIRKKVLLCFLTCTLFAVGKRGHLLFFAISALIVFLVIKKIKLKTIIKAAFALFAIIAACILFANIIPSLSHTFDRIVSSIESNDDASSGRIDMYRDAQLLYKENGYVPIGWGRYASMTEYRHPGLHNDYLQLYYEIGVVGELTILSLDVFWLIVSIKYVQRGNTLAKIVLVFDIFFILYSITGIPHYSEETRFVYYAFNSLLMRNGRNE